MLNSDWRDADQRPSVAPLLYLANGKDFELILTVMGWGTIHMKGREQPDDPQGRVEAVSCSLGA